MALSVRSLRDDYIGLNVLGKIVAFANIHDARASGVLVPSLVEAWISSNERQYPIVEFVPSRHTKIPQAKRVFIGDLHKTINNKFGKPMASRQQVPFILAW
jgi:hypothetical protein